MNHILRNNENAIEHFQKIEGVELTPSELIFRDRKINPEIKNNIIESYDVYEVSGGIFDKMPFEEFYQYMIDNNLLKK